MIVYVSGNIFESPAQVLVNTVNTVGVMGKGIAKEFKRIYPEMFTEYRELCEQGRFDIGQLWLYKTTNKWVLNFPTKKHWRNPSRVEYIQAGLEKFTEVYSKWNLHSVAFPPLGCGNGELNFKMEVKPLMEHYLRNLPFYVFIYPGLKNQPSVPEHRNQEETKEWLNSQPDSLSFNEVWDDLEAILNIKRTFRTVESNTPFEARFDADKKEWIQIVTPGKKFYLYRDQLLGLWQQIRNFGFSNSKIIPNGLQKNISYIYPIFNELEYLTLVNISDSYGGLARKPFQGLQYVGLKRKRNSQFELFDLDKFPQ